MTPMKSVTAIVGLADVPESAAFDEARSGGATIDAEALQGVNGAISMEVPSGACASGGGCATCALSGRCGMRSTEEAAKQREGEQDE